MDRKYYIDNLRIICILLLFPFHSAMFFNNFGDKFYGLIEPNNALSQIVVAVYPWWMSLLFVLAGMSSVYALKKRTGKEYLKERVSKLLIPFIFGQLIIIPPQAYFADVKNYGYTGGYFEHYIKFFTTLTDFTGYDGSFTPAHLWFVLFLFVFSLVCIPLMLWYNKKEKKFDFSKINTALIAVGGIVLLFFTSLVLDIGGKGIGDFLTCFLLGYFVISNEGIQKKLSKYCFIFGALWLILMVIRCILWRIGFLDDSSFIANLIEYAQYKAFEWIGILATIGLGYRFLNKSTKFTDYFSPASFPLYFFHQTAIVICAFFISNIKAPVAVLYTLLLVSGFGLTMLVYEVFKRIPVTRFMFGIKKPKER